MCCTFPELGAVIHTLVVVLVLRAEGRVVVVAQRVPARVAAVVAHEQAVAVDFVAQGELPVLGIAGVAFPVLHRTGEKKSFLLVMKVTPTSMIVYVYFFCLTLHKLLC